MKVLLRSTNEVIDVEDDGFNEELHLRIKEKAKTVGELTPEEFTSGIGQALGSALRDGLKELGVGKVGEGEEGKTRGIVGKAEEKVIDISPRFDTTTRGAAMLAARTVPGWEGRYAGLSLEEAEVRSPEGDVHTWRVMRALATGDVSTLNDIKSHEAKRFGDVDPSVLRAMGIDRATMGTSTAGVLDAAIGGAMVPDPLADLIIIKRDRRERLASRAMRITSEAETITIPKENGVGVVTAVNENAAITETDSTFVEQTFQKRKVGRLARSSKELLESISGAFSLSTILSNQAARKFAVFFDQQGAQDGNATPPNHTNALALAGIATVSGTGGSASRAKILKLLLALPTEWREGTSLTFMGNSTITEIVANLEDGNGRPIYQGTDQPTRPFSDVGNAVAILEGVPYVELPFTEDDLFVGVLDEGFLVLDGGGMKVETTDVGAGAFASDQLVWKFTERRDSGVVDTAAFRVTDVDLTA